VLPGRDGGDVTIHPTGIATGFLRDPAVQQYQVIYDDTGLHARVVLFSTVSESTAAHTLEQLRRALTDAIAGLGAIVPPIVVERVAAMERTSGIGAKYKFIESRVSSNA
jgi:hypothetical protein